MIFRKRDKTPTPPWVAWLIVGTVLYAMFASQQKGSEVQVAVERTKHNLNAHVAKFDAVQGKFLPSMSTPLRVSDGRTGAGTPAICGQSATIAYSAWAAEDKPIDDKATSADPLTFTIGAGKVIPAFERGVIGMKPGGKRSVFASHEFAYGAPGFARDDADGGMVKFDIELLSLTPALPETGAYRLIDTIPNTGGIIFCGQLLRAHVEIWSVDGKKLFSTKDNKSPVEFTPGKSEVFLGLEQGVVGMAPRAGRMLIVPPAFQKTMRGNAPAIDFHLPKTQTVLVEVETLP